MIHKHLVNNLSRSFMTASFPVLCGLVALMAPDMSRPLLAQEFGVNEEQVGETIFTICPRGSIEQGGTNGAEFQTRCDNLVGGFLSGSVDDSQFDNILGKVTSKQTAAQSTNAVEMSNVQMNNLGARFSAIRQGRQGGMHLSGLMLRDSEGKLLSNGELEQFAQNFNRAAAGDEESDFERLGFFVNGNFGWGSREQTSQERGFRQQEFGTTMGVDYRFTDNFVMGTAFGYNHTNSDYFDNAGNMETNAYSGALYGTFYTDNGFFVDGAFTGTYLDYSTGRNIQYLIPTDTVNAAATGNNDGREINLSVAGGYNYNIGALTITPLIRADWINVHINELNENGGAGWALRVDDQSFNSFKTYLGAQTSYPLSYSWGVLIPTVSAEWVHEYLNDARSIGANFQQDLALQKTVFDIFTDGPDRNFVNFNAGMSAQFTHGISAFLNYETILAHKYVSDHSFVTGFRMAF